MIWFGIIATAVAVITGLVANSFRKKAKAQREQNERLRDEISKVQRELVRQVEETAKRDHIIERMEEVNADAAKRKRKIRNHNNSADRARAATDAMSKLSKTGDDHSNGDGATAED